MWILCFPGQKLRNANFRLNYHCYVFIDIESHPLLAVRMKFRGQSTSTIEMHGWPALAAWAVCQIDVYSLYSYMRMRQYLRSAEQKFAFGANSCSIHPAIYATPCSVQLVLGQYFSKFFERTLSRNYQSFNIILIVEIEVGALCFVLESQKRNGTNNNFHADSEAPFSAYE